MKNIITRRKLLVTSLAGMALPFIPKLGHAADVDVVIVGAGAAGLAAAKTLRKRGLNVRLLEASGRTGGRALTDITSFKAPFDLGCTFQHQAHLNPFVKYARRKNIPIGPLPDDENELIWLDGKEASEREYAAVDRQYKKLKKAISRAGDQRRDISVAKAVSGVRRTNYDKMILRWLVNGVEPEDISVLDWWNEADGKDLFSPAGYGTIVQHYGASVPVEFNTSVTKIDWSKSGVAVHSNKGTISARHCVVTVSNGVLAAERIEFSPPLKKRQALVNGIGMASYSTIGLKFERGDVLPTPRNTWFHTIDTQNNSNISWMEDVGGSGVMRVNMHGQAARDLEGLGEVGAVDHAMGELRKSLGKNSVPKLIASKVKLWGNDENYLGAWSAASSGFGNKRKLLKRSVAKRLHFAGEACHESLYATCHGAMVSGIETAEKIK